MEIFTLLETFAQKYPWYGKKYPIFVVTMENFTPFVPKLWEILHYLEQCNAFNEEDCILQF